MRSGETLMEMVLRHTRGAEDIVRRQRALLRRLEDRGLPTAMAEALLAEFQATLEDTTRERDRLIEDQRAGRRDEAGELIRRDR